jgi:very-long-chain (3R)-3-hydroxyacyl-CoA dehydratase
MAPMSAMTVVYLTAYNIFCCCGWCWILFMCIQNIFNDRILFIWDDVSFVLKIVQTAATLEVLHSVFGIVKSSLSATFLQGIIITSM